MPRQQRIDFAGAWHHVMHRGARREAIFTNDNLHVAFLDMLGEINERFEIETHAYALMTNHYHLLLRSKHGNLSDAMRYLNAQYTRTYNRLHGFDGPLFRGRFRSQLLLKEESLPHVFAYIHLNPLRAGLATKVDAPSWSSHRQYMGLDSPYPWLQRDRFLALFGGAESLHDYVLTRQQRRDAWPDNMKMENGWLHASASNSDSPVANSKMTSGLTTAEQVIEQVCRIAKTQLSTLQHVQMGPGANPERRFAVWALRKKTLLTQKEVGAVLKMSSQQVAHVQRRLNANHEPLRSWIREFQS